MVRHRAILAVNPEILRQALRLPASTTILAGRYHDSVGEPFCGSDYPRETFLFVVEDDSLSAVEAGFVLPVVKAVFQHNEFVGPEFIGWDGMGDSDVSRG